MTVLKDLVNRQDLILALVEGYTKIEVSRMWNGLYYDLSDKGVSLDEKKQGIVNHLLTPSFVEFPPGVDVGVLPEVAEWEEGR